MAEITIPNDWKPRPYQLPFWRYMENGGNRAVLVWHRRAGKDSTAINWTAWDAMKNVGLYWHMAPEQKQVRKIVWNAVVNQKRLIDQVFPPGIRKSCNDTEMKIELLNGSIWQCVGSDNYDSLVGANPRGVVFSEYSIGNPAAWDFIRPILVENNGWAIFPYTPRGQNHGEKLFRVASESPDWFCQKLTVDDTHIVPPERIQTELRELTEQLGTEAANALVQQEYFCSFTSSVLGSYYGHLIDELEKQGRINTEPYEPSLPVITAWDIGVGDSTAIWFAQKVGNELKVIDYYEASGVGLPHYVKVLKEKPYMYDFHILPHDIRNTDFSTGISRLDALRGMNVGRVEVLQTSSVDDGIDAVRRLLPKCKFNKQTCSEGLRKLRLYQRDWSDKNKDWSLKPKHDYTSHAADAFRYMAQGYMRFNPVNARPLPAVSFADTTSWEAF